jgi:hypothetical protein
MPFRLVDCYLLADSSETAVMFYQTLLCHISECIRFHVEICHCGITFLVVIIIIIINNNNNKDLRLSHQDLFP